MPKPGSQPANKPVSRFVTAILNFASQRFRKRIRMMPDNMTATIMRAAIKECSVPHWKLCGEARKSSGILSTDDLLTLSLWQELVSSAALRQT